MSVVCLVNDQGGERWYFVKESGRLLEGHEKRDVEDATAQAYFVVVQVGLPSATGPVRGGCVAMAELTEDSLWIGKHRIVGGLRTALIKEGSAGTWSFLVDSVKKGSFRSGRDCGCSLVVVCSGCQVVPPDCRMFIVKDDFEEGRANETGHWLKGMTDAERVLDHPPIAANGWLQRYLLSRR